jgi:hypothetical protein
MCLIVALNMHRVGYVSVQIQLKQFLLLFRRQGFKISGKAGFVFSLLIYIIIL